MCRLAGPAGVLGCSCPVGAVVVVAMIVKEQ